MAMDFRDAGTNLHTSYLTVYQVHNWILYRTFDILKDQTTSNFAISDCDIRELQDVITGRAIVKSRAVDALLQLLAALEAGSVKATGIRAWRGNPRSLPAHYWHHLTLTNRFNPWTGRETCAVFKTEFNRDLWSDLRFNAKGVLAVWPPAGHPQSESESGHAQHCRPVVGEAAPEVKGRLRPAPDFLIHKMISEVYSDTERAGLKPPNLKEIAAPVQERLSAKGHEASARRIQQVAEADEHKGRRRKPGTTVTSEKRRQLR
jgi:hypothetical protein